MRGRGSKYEVGRYIQSGSVVSTEHLVGISLYEPTELVMSAAAGTPLDDIRNILAEHGQQLAFEPIDLGPALGTHTGQSSIGGVFATNLSGSRRIQVGAARDHLLGVTCVNGWGEAFKSGGRVMKNVTGYDLCKAVAGSWGTLAVVTEVTMKVLPQAAETRTLLCFGLPDQTAVDVMTLCLGTPFEVSGTVHLQAPLAAKLSDQDVARGAAAVTAIRIENFPSPARYRIGKLKDRLAAYSPSVELDNARSRIFWEEIRTLARLRLVQPPAVAHLHHAVARREARRRHRPHPRYPRRLRLVRRADLARGASHHRRRHRGDPPRHRRIWRPRHADPRRARNARERRRVPAARAVARSPHHAAESCVRSGRNSQSWPHVSRGLGLTMHTNFSHEQLQDPTIARADAMLKRCVHCGFCTATCPTYVLLGDERDSPRGRIYLIKEMFEQGTVTAPVSYHIDRCLSCLSCMTTCPSGVDYMHLVDLARIRIDHKRSPAQKTTRWLLAKTLPNPGRFRIALLFGWLARPFRGLFSALGMKTGAAALALAPSRLPSLKTPKRESLVRPAGAPVKRVALLLGCVQDVLEPSINQAAIRLLRRHGVEVVMPTEEACCGALQHQLGREDEAHKAARRNVDAWSSALREGPLDAILTTASGCGTMIKDYGHLLARDRGYAERATDMSRIARDISEFIYELGLLPPLAWTSLRVAYHSACSLEHGQQVGNEPRSLLSQAGFTVLEVPEGHICCGSAGTYNMLQPELSGQLRDRKLKNIASVKPDLIATGNIGCMTQLQRGSGVPVVHTVELLDWATGGPCPKPLEKLKDKVHPIQSLMELAGAR